MDDDEEEEEDEFIRHMLFIPWWLPSSRLVRSRQLALPPSSLGSGGDAHSVVAGDEAAEFIFSRFLIVEFQKFFISLSVRPGNLAAI